MIGIVRKDVPGSDDARAALYPSMIELHVPAERTPLDAEVEEALRDLVVAHEVRIAAPHTVPVDLPAVHDGGRWVAAGDLRSYLHELTRFLGDWRKFQTDACYVDDDGSIC